MRMAALLSVKATADVHSHALPGHTLSHISYFFKLRKASGQMSLICGKHVLQSGLSSACRASQHLSCSVVQNGKLLLSVLKTLCQCMWLEILHEHV